jgi:hypothetical protein
MNLDRSLPSNKITRSRACFACLVTTIDDLFVAPFARSTSILQRSITTFTTFTNTFFVLTSSLDNELFFLTVTCDRFGVTNLTAVIDGEKSWNPRSPGSHSCLVIKNYVKKDSRQT